MNTAFLIDHVMRSVKPLRVDRILQAPGVLHVVSTEADTGAVRICNDFSDADRFFRVLKASITIPLLSGAAIAIDDVALVDGGLVQQIAFESAIQAGASHLMVLMTRKEGGLERRSGKIRGWTEGLLLRYSYNDAVSRAYRSRNAGINEIVRKIENPPDEVQVSRVVRSAAAAADVGTLTTDAALLRKAEQEAREAVFSYLDRTCLDG